MSCLAQVYFFRSSHFHSPYSRTPSRDFGVPSFGVTGESNATGPDQSEPEDQRGPQFPFLIAQIMEGECRRAGTSPHWGEGGRGEGPEHLCLESLPHEFPKETLGL